MLLLKEVYDIIENTRLNEIRKLDVIYLFNIIMFFTL
jgi:hypothetical protein